MCKDYDPVKSPLGHGTTGWSAARPRQRPPRSPFGREQLSCWNALAHDDADPAGGASQMPPIPPTPPEFPRGAPKGLPPRRPCLPRERITCWVIVVQRVSERRTIRACHPTTVCHCMRKDVMLACATHSGPRWGCTSPHRNSGVGGGAMSSNSKRGKQNHYYITVGRGGRGGVLDPPKDATSGGWREKKKRPHQGLQRMPIGQWQLLSRRGPQH